MLNLNLNTKSDFKLSFLVNMGASRWYYGDQKIANNFLDENFKSQIPKNEIFEISSMIFNIPKHKKEILTQYKCYFDEKSNGLFLILSESICFSEFTKEIMMNLFDFSEKVGIKTISFLVSKKNPQFIRIMQDLMIVGFKSNEEMKEITIEGDNYKVMEIPVNIDEKIEEFYF
jgi:hypothetical protein